MSEESGVRVRTEDGTELPALTEPVLDELLDGAVREQPYLEVARGPDEWITARLLPDDMFRLTHRTSRDSDEYELYTGDAILLRDILFAWIDRDPWWCERVVWSRVDPAVAELESVRGELAGLLDGFDVLDLVTGAMDDALARADALLAQASTESEFTAARLPTEVEVGGVQPPADVGFSAAHSATEAESARARLSADPVSGEAQPPADVRSSGAHSPTEGESGEAQSLAEAGEGGSSGAESVSPEGRQTPAAEVGSLDGGSSDFDDADPFARLDALLAVDPADFDLADFKPADFGPADFGPADFGPADFEPADFGPDGAGSAESRGTASEVEHVETERVGQMEADSVEDDGADSLARSDAPPAPDLRTYGPTDRDR